MESKPATNSIVIFLLIWWEKDNVIHDMNVYAMDLSRGLVMRTEALQKNNNHLKRLDRPTKIKKSHQLPMVCNQKPPSVTQPPSEMGLTTPGPPGIHLMIPVKFLCSVSDARSCLLLSAEWQKLNRGGFQWLCPVFEIFRPSLNFVFNTVKETTW